jgi:hypothetical protein
MRLAPFPTWAASLIVALLLCMSAPRDAHAYAWMIRHGYTGCLPCHADPSGSGPLTAYGRAQSEILLSSRYGPASEEASPIAGPLWGAVHLPDDVRLGGDFRGAFLNSRQENGPINQRFILMRSDLYGDVKVWRLRAAGSLGYSQTGALDAAITRRPTDNLVSRDHWLGFELDEDGSWLARAGRMAIPFGLRNIEHTLWVRSTTRTDLLDGQQHGLALSVSKDWIRAEVMAILGNYQLRPDEFRERGYSAYVEFAPIKGLAAGLSSLLTRAQRDFRFRVTDYRQAHGLFARYVPATPLVFLAEGDWLYQSLTNNGHRAGYAAVIQGDWEPTQGFHVVFAGEAKNEGGPGEPSSYGAWASAVWFFMPHADVRVDNIFQTIGGASGDTSVFTVLAQLHVYL